MYRNKSSSDLVMAFQVSAPSNYKCAEVLVPNKLRPGMGGRGRPPQRHVNSPAPPSRARARVPRSFCVDVVLVV